MRRAFTLLALLAMPLSLHAAAQPLTVTSPDGSLRLTFALSESGAPTYAAERHGEPVVLPSRLGLILRDAAPLALGFEVEHSATRTHDGVWETVWGERREVRDAYTELRVDLRETTAAARRMSLVFRVFDDGLGFRYLVREQDGLGVDAGGAHPIENTFAILDESTEFALAGEPSETEAWWIPAYDGNRYETLYQHTSAAEMGPVHTPVTFEMPNGLFLSVHEAALVDYSSMTLAPSGQSAPYASDAMLDPVTHTNLAQPATVLRADLIPWSDGTRVYASLPLATPWRVVLVGESAADLAVSDLVLNLNEPNQIEDTSWIEPQKYVGIWWGMHLGQTSWHSGEKHGATTERTKKYLDFAAENGFGGVLVEGWNVGWDGDWVHKGHNFRFTEAYPDFDVAALAEYARERGVRIIGHHETGGAISNYEAQLEAAYAFENARGVRAVKTGYVGHGRHIKRTGPDGREHREWHHGQFMVRHYQKTVEAAARHEVMLNIHEPIKGTGLRRTWPNLLTREGARGQEYDAWASDGGNPPEHTTILPFTRMLAGPMDFTPGTFDLNFDNDRPSNRVNTTLAKQLALYVVIYSPLQMASDLAENYPRFPDALRFIKDVPVDWEHSRVLAAEIGDYVVTARQERGGADWYLGAVTDEHARSLEVALDFLEPDREYVAEIYRDGEGADWEASPYAFERVEQRVRPTDTLTLDLAAGGGQAIRFRAAQ